MESGIPKIILNKISGSVITARTHSLCFYTHMNKNYHFLFIFKGKIRVIMDATLLLKTCKLWTQTSFQLPFLTLSKLIFSLERWLLFVKPASLKRFLIKDMKTVSLSNKTLLVHGFQPKITKCCTKILSQMALAAAPAIAELPPCSSAHGATFFLPN